MKPNSAKLVEKQKCYLVQPLIHGWRWFIIGSFNLRLQICAAVANPYVCICTHAVFNNNATISNVKYHSIL